MGSDRPRPRSRLRAPVTGVLAALAVVAAVVVVVVVVVRPWEPDRVDLCGHDLDPYRSTVYSVDADTGEVEWSREVQVFDGSPGVDGDVVHWGIGHPDGSGGLTREVVALDLATGEPIDPSQPVSDVVGTVVVPPAGGATVPDIGTTPTLPENAVVDGDRAFAAVEGSLVAYDATSAAILWTVPLDKEWTPFPTVSGGHVVVANHDRHPICV